MPTTKSMSQLKYTDQINNNNLRKEPVTILYKGNHYDLEQYIYN